MGKSSSKRKVPKAPTKRSSSKSWIYWLVIGLVAAAAIVAVIATVVSSQNEAGPKSNDNGAPADSIKIEGDDLPRFPDKGVDRAVGDVAPTVQGESFDPKDKVDISNDEAHVIILMAHWCPHCQKEIPEIVKLQEAGSLPDNVKIYGVATGIDKTKANWPTSTWLKEEGWTFPTVVDDKESTIFDAYGGTGFPFAVFVGPDGKVTSRTSGELGADKWKAKIDELSKLAEATSKGE